jgi:formylglycine-generating enzyme required for sulfatase activity
VNVSWNDAVAFCDWLSRVERKAYRLPTEAEWEYACRAGAATRYSSGDDPETVASVGNVADATAKKEYPDWTWTIAARDGYVYTAPVGRFRANAFGLYDMHGNVWEWCQDWDDTEYYRRSPLDDPVCTTRTTRRVIRGGGWDNAPRDYRSAVRNWHTPGPPGNILGFRVAREESAR